MSEFAKSTNSLMLSTLKKTFELSSNRMLESDSDLMSAKNKKKMSTRSIIDDLSETNIMSGPRQQIPSSDHGIHFAAFATAFATGIQHGHEQFKCLHNDQLPPSSEN